MSTGLIDAAQAADPSFDGRYGSPAGTTAGSGACSNSLNAKIVVQNNVASMATAQRGTFEGKIAADGSLSVQQGKASLTGKFAGKAFDGYYSGGGGCTYQLHYEKLS